MATNKTVFFLIGILLVVLGVSMMAPYAIQIFYSENSHSFISSSFVTIFMEYYLFWQTWKKNLN